MTAAVTTRGARGFSLVEVILALALLGSVLISISGLLVLANRQVNGGRTQTTALSVAKDILEEMESWSFHRTYEAFDVNAASDVSNPVIDTRVDSYASRWQPLLDRELSDAHAEILLQSVDGTVAPPDLQDASCIRVVVTVHWREGLRQRSAQLAAIKM